MTAAMPDDFSHDGLAPPLPPEEAGDRKSYRDLLGLLENARIGRRAPDGAITVRHGEPAGCVLYGPYLYLSQGRYRLSFRCRAATPRFTAQPVIGIDIVVLNRFQLLWRDFTASELREGMCSVDFTVAPEHSLEGRNEGRFEFRFFHLGNAGFAITAINLDRLPADAAAPTAKRSRWRLLGRLHKTWRGHRGHDGAVKIMRAEPAGLVLYGAWPYLRLPGGTFRLLVGADARLPRRSDAAALAVEIHSNSRWRDRSPLTALRRHPAACGVRQIMREATAAELEGGPIALDFTVPNELAVEAGADAPFDVRLYHQGSAALRIRAVDLVQLDREVPVAAPRLRPSGRGRVVIVGNCQSETLRQGFVRSEALSRRFDVKYHFVQLPQNLREYAARDLERCDILLIQDIRLWDEFPLRDCVRPGAEVLRFPLVRFASLWPFDAWNGPGDNEAHDREAPNLVFPYLDGLLGRLRHEIPDREGRFAAYRSLELPPGLPRVVNYRRLHQLEERRLAGIDKEFGIDIGSFTLDNFRSRRLFHTTVRPNWEVFTLLMQFLARLVGVTEPIRLGAGVEAVLRNPQVPVHPKVARDLGVRWADEKTRYLDRGREITWETYIRRYIEHYG
jgi:polysaccharide biosynthesis acetyltransferase WcbI-like protein